MRKPQWLWKKATLRMGRWEAFYYLVILNRSINFGLWVKSKNKITPDILIDGMETHYGQLPEDTRRTV